MDGGTKLQAAMKTQNSQKEKKKAKKNPLEVERGKKKKQKKTYIVTENI